MYLKKRIFVCCMLITISYIGFSQKAKNLRVSATSEFSFFNNGTLTSYGLSAEYFIHKNFSLNYQYTFGTNQMNNTYMHYPGSIAGLVEMFRTDSYYIYSNSNDEGWAYLLFLTCIIPEGVSFHTYPRSWLELAPFVNPFSADFNILDNRRSTITLSLGMKIHIKPVSNFSLSPHFGLKHIYKTGNVGTIFGFSFGLLF